MPKERLHLLLADLTLRRIESETGNSPATPRWKEAFLHGAMAPDLLFYDVPSFRFSGTAGKLHAIMKSNRSGSFPEAMLTFLSTPAGLRNRPWFLGMAHHFMVDESWHPLIDRYTELRATPCDLMHLKSGDCHLWLESELETFWLERLGPEAGYLPFLKALGRREDLRHTVGAAYGELFEALRIIPSPPAATISGCFSRQIRLLLELNRPVWARLKGFLLWFKPTKYIGALIVPRRASSKALVSERSSELLRLWQQEFLDQTIRSITAQFLSLPGWSWLSQQHQSPPTGTDRKVSPKARNS